jgi:maltose/moltooligosaccharide transporter
MATTTTTSESVSRATGPVEHKPLMSTSALLMMNLGFFGVQFSFGLTQSAVNPLFLLIGAKPSLLPILNLAGPVTGLVIQPLIGALSDRTWSPRWGRRRPFVTGGAILCALILFVFPFVGALWLGVICFWLLDAGNNTSMEPYRAFISDRLPRSQLARGFLTQSMFTGAGAVLANISLFGLQKVSSLDKTAGNGVPYWMYVCFWIGTICILLTVLTAMARTKELTPSDEDLAEMRSAPRGLGSAIRDIKEAVRTMPIAMHKIGLVFVFQWYAMFIYWQFLAVSLGETVFHATPDQKGPFDRAIAWSGLENGAYNFVTMISALALVGFAQRIGAKRVHAIALGLAAVALIWLAHIHNQYLALVPMIGVGIFWASAVGVPYLMVASMVPAKRTGVYMGILNMMIVVPMLVETVTFGWIFSHLLHNKGHNAIMLAGVLMAIGGVAMLWVNPPSEEHESSIMPLGGKRSITVYDRVVVGSDGTPPSLYTVDRAAEVAQAAQARLVVVTAYNEAGTSAAAPSPSAGQHREVYGLEAARQALEHSVTALTKERARFIDQRLIPGDTAQALLDTVGNNPANLIVVGSRGLGAIEGQRLGSVARNVVRNAVCDVLIVQTSALDEERMLGEQLVEPATDRAGLSPQADPEDQPRTR